MTTQIEAMKSALAAMEHSQEVMLNECGIGYIDVRAITALRAAIEAAEKVGPDAVVVDLQSCFPSCAVVPVFPVGTLFYLHPPSAEIEELRKDAERYHFILPIVTGIDSDNADKIAMAIATQLMKGLDGDAAIDAAMQEKQP